MWCYIKTLQGSQLNVSYHDIQPILIHTQPALLDPICSPPWQSGTIWFRSYLQRFITFLAILQSMTICSITSVKLRWVDTTTFCSYHIVSYQICQDSVTYSTRANICPIPPRWIRLDNLPSGRLASLIHLTQSTHPSVYLLVRCVTVNTIRNSIKA
jgi:hypothetical protein